jgi:hypothetical protein
MYPALIPSNPFSLQETEVGRMKSRPAVIDLNVAS